MAISGRDGHQKITPVVTPTSDVRATICVIYVAPEQLRR